jgi:hypothetical protein
MDEMDEFELRQSPGAKSFGTAVCTMRSINPGMHSRVKLFLRATYDTAWPWAYRRVHSRQTAQPTGVSATNGLSFFVGSEETVKKLLRSNQYRHRLCRVVATNS